MQVGLFAFCFILLYNKLKKRAEKMNNFKKNYKQLCKNYNRKLKELHKVNFNSLNNNLEYFVTYLKYMRDYYILTEPLPTDKENLKVTALVTAVGAYEKYRSCKDKYYCTKEDGTEEALIEGTPEEVKTKYELERNFHWNCFWSLVSLNIESWTGKANAAI